LTITRRPLYLALVFLAVMLSTAYASEDQKTLINRGDEFFKIRGAHHLKDKAVPANIRNALSAYLEAYDAGNPTPELIIKIMDASYYYVTYAETDKTLRKKAVDKAMEIGEKGLEAFPDSAGIHYWQAALWAGWSRLHGMIASSRKNVTQKIKDLAESTIKLDPAYCEGGGYRTLGRLHFKTPRIPFFLSWPRKKTALAYLKKAVEIGPHNLTNHLFYAESLIERGKRKEARKEVDFIQKAKIDKESVVEELRVKREALDLLGTLDDKIDPRRENRMRIGK